MTPQDRIARAERAKNACDEFLSPAITMVKAEYATRLERIADGMFWRPFAAIKVMIALKIARRVEAQIRAIIEDGKLADHELERARNLSKINPYQRDVMGV